MYGTRAPCTTVNIMQYGYVKYSLILPRNSQLEVSYLHPRTGKITYWQSGGGVRSGATGGGVRSGATGGRQEHASLLELSETVWGLGLERPAYLLILLVVLFSSQTTHLYSARYCTYQPWTN